MSDQPKTFWHSGGDVMMRCSDGGIFRVPPASFSNIQKAHELGLTGEADKTPITQQLLAAIAERNNWLRCGDKTAG